MAIPIRLEPFHAMENGMATHSSILGEFHGQRSLVGYCPQGHKESDTTELLHFHFSLSCTGEGNGNPLQCSCLENPKDGGASVGCCLWGLTDGRRKSRQRRMRWLDDIISCCSIAKSCLTLCDSVDCSMPGSSVLHYLPSEFVQTHVHEKVLKRDCMLEVGAR